MHDDMSESMPVMADQLFLQRSMSVERRESSSSSSSSNSCLFWHTVWNRPVASLPVKVAAGKQARRVDLLFLQCSLPAEGEQGAATAATGAAHADRVGQTSCFFSAFCRWGGKPKTLGSPSPVLEQDLFFS